MFWIILIAYLAGMATAGLIIVFVLCLLHASAKEQEALDALHEAQFGPFP